MFKNIFRRPLASGNGILNTRRSFSLISIHSSFPATLYRFQLNRESRLYDQKLQQEHDEVEDAVSVSEDGLVYPEVSDSRTSIPNTLVLLRERNIRSRFSLLPSSPMPLNDLNNILTEFYLKCGTTTPADKWLEEHQYCKAFDDTKDDWIHH
ncbi:conserved hypothetical protein [Microsporum canis CBS 113480]|uniref:Tse2 ADP-ribosyltransferase toxin domain-containing protein n=1 Tax=Arthroderma otae (strain ATCC MYA-4605 / CBS 113480) TaxID=554155 RepID=C5FN70_ARTOC|nr:conserved hypothetical protein [Microsporum canis CBS 113480]EEQ31306.1 conserved hypothetical protein [Microsporum canis CBS 113480]